MAAVSDHGYSAGVVQQAAVVDDHDYNDSCSGDG
jgi:hypothetical protein